MLELVKESGERELHVTWKFFSLAQVNANDPEWTAWGAPDSETVRGRLAFRAAAAARRQDAFESLHMPLLLARHRDREDIDDPRVIKRLAGAAGLDGDRFGADLADRRTLEALARDHSEARAKHGVFGTPTFVFPNGAAAYVRLAGVPSKEDADPGCRRRRRSAGVMAAVLGRDGAARDQRGPQLAYERADKGRLARLLCRHVQS